MPEPTTVPAPAADPNQPKPRCRAITTDGHRCRKPATYNGHLCWPHTHHRRPVLPDPSHVVVPLLEDHASVQLVLSQVAHGLFTHKLDIDRARALIHLCQVASYTMPRPPRMKNPGDPSLSPASGDRVGSPDPSSDPNQPSAEGGSAPDGQLPDSRVPHVWPPLPDMGSLRPNPQPGDPSLSPASGDRVGSPDPSSDPDQPSAEGGSAPDGQSAAPNGQSANSERSTTRSDPSVSSVPSVVSSLQEEEVYRLALDYEGIICGDGDLPAPSAHWQPASPEATPWDVLQAAPNQSKPTPRSPLDPDTHCSCPICGEIEKMKGRAWDHPHLQPTVNPYCKRNRSGCEGPGSPTQCSFCEGLYKYDPRKYDRRRQYTRRPSERSEESRGSQHHDEPKEFLPPTRPSERSEEPRPSETRHSERSEESRESQHHDEPKKFLPPRRSSTPDDIIDDFDPRLCLPNPIPEQFPDDDPMLRGYIPLPDTLDPEAAGSSRPVADANPCSLNPIPCFSGNTQKL